MSKNLIYMPEILIAVLKYNTSKCMACFNINASTLQILMLDIIYLESHEYFLSSWFCFSSSCIKMNDNRIDALYLLCIFTFLFYGAAFKKVWLQSNHLIIYEPWNMRIYISSNDVNIFLQHRGLPSIVYIRLQ